MSDFTQSLLKNHMKRSFTRMNFICVAFGSELENKQ